MTSFVAMIVFGTIYVIYYLLPFLFVIYLLEFLNFKNSLFNIVLFILALGLISLRTKLAVAAYGDRDMKLYQAHIYSGRELKGCLVFIPVIGKYFEKK